MHADAAGLLAFLSSYGYPAVALLVALAAAGVPVPIPISAAFVALGALTADPRGPSFVGLVVVATLAAATGHSVDYWAGRGGGPPLRKGMARLERVLGADLFARVERGMGRGGSLLILLTSCVVTTVATPVSLLAGVTRVPYGRYLALELAGEAIYFTGYLTLGRALGPAMARSLPTTILFSLLLGALILAPALLLRVRPGLLRRVAGDEKRDVGLGDTAPAGRPS
jgi:membrane protein DedA with SNARE-associated domain